MEKKTLTASKTFDIRFSEVDSMNVVWHGNYAIYFEDAREEFGRKFDLGYLTMYGEGYYAPLVELSFKYKSPIIYGMKPEITITYTPTEAAKIVFDYEIRDTVSGRILATGRSVQVFMTLDYKMMLTNPEFFVRWKKRWEVEA